MMKVAAILGNREAGLVDKPTPQAKQDFVLVKVRAAPMCKEWGGFKGGIQSDNLGHEAVGEVAQVAQPGAVNVGDRVVVQPQFGCGRCYLCLAGEHIHCMNGRGPGSPQPTYAQYVLKTDWLCSPIPDGVSYEHAGMALCGLGATFGAMQQMKTTALETILITGLGPVGLGGVINARYLGSRVICVESHPYRSQLAIELGAETVLDPNDEGVVKRIRDLTEGMGVDHAIDCSGAPRAHRLMIDALRRKGQACIVGEGGDFPVRASEDMIRKGIVLRGNWHYNLGDYPKLMRVVQESADQLDKLITHKFPMSQVQEAWELQISGECGKVVLDPWA